MLNDTLKPWADRRLAEIVTFLCADRNPMLYVQHVASECLVNIVVDENTVEFTQS